ncbi:unconventional prefoldin RPB5 interactor-like protein [Musca vetustissima]|uniref:unconventional prefoldin RPB5 interactor-like protein n=1 Tax=Musca vetustissima TaxID=27455 RepID=UPI002AB78917|nr:unconventional prefoldin RPB5 interactor-like protein [Musca vetustissima]
MNKREDALIEAIQKNAEETERWRTYLKENETAKENLAMFQKRYTVEVMVPVGKKALMPGHLIHTNEVLVGHYQGYFSKCSAHTAGQICDLRIKTAKEHLKKLETELEMWQNKLEKPYVEGVVPSGEEREIIEDFDEEKEKLWKEQHKIRVREAKQQEKLEREKELAKEQQKSKENETKEKSDEEIFKMLEEAEIMEELEQELENLEVDEVNDETIRKLMSGEMHLPPEKKRVAHDLAKKEETEKKKDEKKEENENVEGATLQTNIVKKTSLKSNKVMATNNNVVPNPEISVENADDDEEPLPEEVRIIKEQAKFLDNEDQIGFYEYQIEIIRQKIRSLSLRSEEDVNEKVRLLTVLDHMEELLDFAETAAGNEELELAEKQEEESEKESKKEEEAHNDKESAKSTQKRRISFAAEDQTLEFCKNEAVTQMLPKRDIIRLDDDDDLTKAKDKENIPPVAASPDKKDLIKARVEQNFQFASETQSKQDFDLVNKILETSMGKINTLHIKFKHSPASPSSSQSDKVSNTIMENVDNRDSEIPGSPADFYDLYLKSLEGQQEEQPSTLFINSYEGEDKVKIPVLKESDRQQAYTDPKAEFSNPKSILRNKSAVDKENQSNAAETEQVDKKKKPKKKRTPKEEEEFLSAYYKVMNDVVEKPITEPEPLPEGKFVDAHAPKRRVSRFKQMRQGTEKT